MSNKLTLHVTPTGEVTKALINENDVGDVISVTQSLVRGSLQGALTLKFTEVSVVNDEPEPPAEIEATFVAGESSIALEITSPVLGSGNSFAYKHVSPMAVLPVPPNKGDIITGATKFDGTTATLLVGADGDGYLLYELDAQNKVVSYEAFILQAGEFIE